ncbi:short-subunit dehydrogenase [Dysgonomonas sp. PH5-45]|uniref:SDR family NAD(P)-dependent oxidoreductase n=1 Tax=unclassified Dysgonomonas TaxID=2630389 RepID=UPI00247720FD|nr:MULTISPECIES: SDR family NAD(P)-dependent oxidoreductase [unclassified Dysgonomonas]MDH6354852.1 short-subunit dehydrogenase [Dysgonomonas sp. PH5-45]MDH6387751.1 short-subunit dehydrogenase [Dysgonomonas sp. PH5-37]
MNLTNKKIIVTGASSGIGKELLFLLAAYQGVRIIAVARGVEQIDTFWGKVIPFACDVSSPEGIDALFTFAQQTFGNTDLFIANAGFAYIEKLDEADWKHIEDIFSLNTFSPIYTLQKLIQEGNSEKNFVCTVSAAAIVSLPAYALYCSSKSALRHFINTYRYEKPANLHITTVYPVATRTGFFDKATGKKATPLPFPAQNVQIVAKAIIKGIEKNKKQVFPSFIFRVAYPLGRAFPFLFTIYSLLEKRKMSRWLK